MTASKKTSRTLLFVGTYTKSCQSDGIYIYDFNPDTARTRVVTSTKKVVSPSFLSISLDRRLVYSVNENGEQSSVSVFAFDTDQEQIKLFNQIGSYGASPCYIVDDGNCVFVANYEGGTIAVFDKFPDGSIAGIRQVVHHHGNGPNAERQEKAHVHMISLSPDRNYLLATDLGSDEIYVYDFNHDGNGDVLSLKAKYKSNPGSGPRHFTFSRDGLHLYLLHELDGRLTTFSYDDGKLGKIDETTIVEDGFKGEIGGGDIHIDNGGRFLYATNRGDANTISVFGILAQGKLKHVETIGTKGKGPRNFAFSPDNKFLLIGHQDSNEIVIFGVDQQSGKLSDTGKRIPLCAPVCLKFMTI